MMADVCCRTKCLGILYRFIKSGKSGPGCHSADVPGFLGLNKVELSIDKTIHFTVTLAVAVLS